MTDLWFKVYIQYNEILSGWCSFNCHIVNMSYCHGLFDFHISKFWQFDVSASNADIVSLVECSVRLMIVMFAFESRMLCTLLKEVNETAVQIP